MTTAAVDLDCSSMSIDTFDGESLQSNPFHIKNRNELIIELNKVSQIILNQQAELNDLRPLGIIFEREKNPGLFRIGSTLIMLR